MVSMEHCSRIAIARACTMANTAENRSLIQAIPGRTIMFSNSFWLSGMLHCLMTASTMDSSMNKPPKIIGAEPPRQTKIICTECK